jgi:hypothetical protein
LTNSTPAAPDIQRAIYVNNKIFNKLVEVGAIDVNKVDRKAIHDSLVRDGLIDDPNVQRDPFDY